MTAWRVMTWNILGSHRPDLGEIAARVREQTPDALSLQEVRKGQVRVLAHELGWRWSWARKHYPYTPLLWWRAEGIAILSPWAVSEPMSATISPGVSTWLYKHRVVMAATITRRDSSLRLFNTHLASDNDDQRIAQARRAAARVSADPSPTIALTGDLNTTGDSTVDVLREFRTVGLVDPGGDCTNPSPAPYQRLDYVLLPDDATFVESITPDGGDPWAQLSDHLPVTVTFDP